MAEAMLDAKACKGVPAKAEKEVRAEKDVAAKPGSD
jgi:hypothetical protein